MSFLPDVVETVARTALQDISLEKQQEMCLLLQKTIANLSALGPGVGDRFGLLPDSFCQIESVTGENNEKSQG
jgi:hypothetical protein